MSLKLLTYQSSVLLITNMDCIFYVTTLVCHSSIYRNFFPHFCLLSLFICCAQHLTAIRLSEAEITPISMLQPY